MQRKEDVGKSVLSVTAFFYLYKVTKEDKTALLKYNNRNTLSKTKQQAKEHLSKTGERTE